MPSTPDRADHRFAAAATLGEGPIWHAGTLWFVDIEANTLSRLDGDERAIFDAGQRIGFAVPTARGDWIVGLQHGLARWTPGQNQPAVFHDPEPDRPDNRFNDGKADPAGRLFAGTLKMPCDQPVASLYRINHDCSTDTIATGLTISNGLAWDARRRAMYHTDTPTQRITRYDWDPATSAATNPRTLIELDPSLGSPDGMTIDTAGRLYVAMWGGGRVLVIDPTTASVAAAIAVDAPHVTSCCFGGPDLDTLYITSARIGLTDEQLAAHPRSGDIFAAAIGLRGLPADTFIDA
ncbi:MAG: SMP-30/gluconolactonase/LRE family protein [Planctomycetota bacterium]